MPSKLKRHRGDQFLIIYPSIDDSLTQGVVDQTAAEGSVLSIHMSARPAGETHVIIKTLIDLDFRGEEKYSVGEIVPKSITKIEARNDGLKREIEKLKGYPGFLEHTNKFRKDSSQIVRSEEGAFMSTDMTTNPNFDTTKETKFGVGHRRVFPIKCQKTGKITGYRFMPFRDYTPECASDIFGYDTFEDVLKNVYPYTISERKVLEEMYMSRPIIPPIVDMIPSEWQEVACEIADQELPKKGIKQRKYHWFADLEGDNGKSMLTDYFEYIRGDDTLIVGSIGDLKDLIHSVKGPLLKNGKIKNVVIDIPKQVIDTKRQNFGFHILDDHKHDGAIFHFAEMCVNGRFTSLKYESCNFRVPQGGLNVIILSNSVPFIPAASPDRWHIYIIRNKQSLMIKDWTFDKEKEPKITTMRETLDWYMSNPKFVEYLHEQKISTEFYTEMKLEDSLRTRRKKFSLDIDVL